MMAPRHDFHIHTSLSACANPAMRLSAIVARCRKLGLECIGIADHLNRPEQAQRNASLRQEILRLTGPMKVYLGAEAGFMRQQGRHALTEQAKSRWGYQYAIGSHHSAYIEQYDPARLVEAQHRHHLLTCQDRAIDILGHPYRLLHEEFEARGWPWFDSVRAVPRSMVRELGQAARQTGTAIEINTTSNLAMKFNPPSYFEEYVEFLAILAEQGATFALGSDAHELEELGSIRLAWEVVDRLGLPPERIWQPIEPSAP